MQVKGSEEPRHHSRSSLPSAMSKADNKNIQKAKVDVHVLRTLCFTAEGNTAMRMDLVDNLDPPDFEAYTPSRCDYDIVTESTSLSPISKPGCILAPFLKATLDIEVSSQQRDDGGYDFPDPELPGCPISCLCVRTSWTTPPSAFDPKPKMHGPWRLCFVYIYNKDADAEFI